MMSIPAKEKILDEFLRGFSIGGLSNASPGKALIDNMTPSAFKVSTKNGAWLLKLVDKNGEDLEKENTLLSALHAKGGELFIPYCRTSSGASYLNWPGDHSQALNLVAMPFIENSPTFKWTAPTWTLAHSAAAGASLKKFHADSKACLADRSIAAEAYENIPIERMRSSLLDKIEAAGKTQLNLFGNCLPPYETLRALILNQQFNEVESLPSPVVLHGDFHAGNVLFKGTAVKSIIDLDAEFCFMGNPLFDLSYALIAFSSRWQGGRFGEKTSVADYLGMDHFKGLLGAYQNLENPDEALNVPLKQALAYSCMLFLLWAFDLNPTDPDVSQRILSDASGILTALRSMYS